MVVFHAVIETRHSASLHHDGDPLDGRCFKSIKLAIMIEG